jgi:hypothetical protein
LRAIQSRAIVRDAGERPEVALVTSLAEGADRLVARIALDLGYALVCVTPFPRAAFALDFTPPKAIASDALAEFEALLGRAEAGAGLKMIELSGSRTDEGAAYAAAGRAVAELSDVVLALWDGAPAKGPGGTADTVAFALGLDRPVLKVDPGRPDMVIRLGPDGLAMDAARAEAPDELKAMVDEAMRAGAFKGTSRS